MPQTQLETNETMARRRARYLANLIWHIGAYLIICAFLILLDQLGDRRLNWSLWIVGAWGFALAFHVLAYVVDGSNFEDRKTREYLDRRKGDRSAD